MTDRILSIDQNGFPIQTMGPVGITSTMATTAVTDRVVLPAGVGAGDIIRVASSVDTYFAFGDVTIDATTSDSLFTAGVEVFKIPKDVTHIAALIVGATNGVLTVDELE